MSINYKLVLDRNRNPFYLKNPDQLNNNIFFSNVLQPEIVNSLSAQGQLPLGLALLGRNAQIALTLVNTGKADVNAYNGDVNNSLRFRFTQTLIHCRLLF